MKPTSALHFSVKDDEKVDAIKKILEENEIGYNYNNYKEFMLNVDSKSIKKNAEVIKQIHSIKNKKTTEDV